MASKLSFALRCALAGGALALPACVGTIETHDEIAADPQPIFWWSWHTELVENDDLYTGSPAWADDDSDVAVVEARYQRRLSFPPLQGWWERRDFRFRVKITQPGSSSSFALSAELPGQVEELTWMKTAGYALVKRWVPETQTLEWLRVDAVDGATASVVAVVGNDLGLAEHAVVPSPDGARLAHVACTTASFTTAPDGTLVVTPVQPMPCTVRQLDAHTLAEVAPAAQVVLPEMPHGVTGKEGNYSYPGTTSWTEGGTLLVGNFVATTFAIAADGSVAAVAVPTCRGPLTTSSQVSSGGQRIGVNGKKVVTRAAEPNGNDPFGC